MVTKREKLFIAGGAIILAGAFAGRTALLRSLQNIPVPSRSWLSSYADPQSKDPRVIIGYDGPYWRLKNVVRVDVRNGVPHTRDRDGIPLSDIVSYVNAEASRIGSEFVVVSASPEEKMGAVVAVIDECRKARVKAVVLNESMDAISTK